MQKPSRPVARNRPASRRHHTGFQPNALPKEGLGSSPGDRRPIGPFPAPRSPGRHEHGRFGSASRVRACRCRRRWSTRFSIFFTSMPAVTPGFPGWFSGWCSGFPIRCRCTRRSAPIRCSLCATAGVVQEVWAGSPASGRCRNLLPKGRCLSSFWR